MILGKNLKSDLTVAETKIELLELENESITSQLNITDLEIRNLQDKYDLLSSQIKFLQAALKLLKLDWTFWRKTQEWPLLK